MHELPVRSAPDALRSAPPREALERDLRELALHQRAVDLDVGGLQTLVNQLRRERLGTKPREERPLPVLPPRGRRQRLRGRSEEQRLPLLLAQREAQELAEQHRRRLWLAMVEALLKQRLG